MASEYQAIDDNFGTPASEPTTEPSSAAPKTRAVYVEALSRLHYLVSTYNNKISKLNKRNSLTLAPIVVKTSPTRTVFVAAQYPGAHPMDQTPRFVVDVEISGDKPIIAGWEVVAVLSLTDAGYLASKISGSTLANVAPFASRGGDCDHCRANRRRATTYVVKAVATDTLKVVGSSCVVDFTGHKSPGALLAYAEYLSGLESELDELGDDEGRSGGGGRGTYKALPLVTFLGFVRKSIRTDGWLSKTAAFDRGGTPTATRAWEAVGYIERAERDLVELKAKIGLTREQVKEKLKATETTDIEYAELLNIEAKFKDIEETMSYAPTANDSECAAADLDIVEEVFSKKTEANDFEANTLTVIRQGFAFGKNLGLAAAICQAADRIRKTEAEEVAKRSIKNEWFGEVGKRQIYTLKVEHIAEYQSSFNSYGRRSDDQDAQTGYIYIMSDAEGRRCKWFTTSGGISKDASASDSGRTFTVKATVKKHEEYRGIKETILNRVTLQKEVV